jgi:hypothetical protein
MTMTTIWSIIKIFESSHLNSAIQLLTNFNTNINHKNKFETHKFLLKWNEIKTKQSIPLLVSLTFSLWLKLQIFLI